MCPVFQSECVCRELGESQALGCASVSPGEQGLVREIQELWLIQVMAQTGVQDRWCERRNLGW